MQNQNVHPLKPTPPQAASGWGLEKNCCILFEYA
jgi:hypothetical protein